MAKEKVKRYFLNKEAEDSEDFRIIIGLNGNQSSVVPRFFNIYKSIKIEGKVHDKSPASERQPVSRADYIFRGVNLTLHEGRGNLTYCGAIAVEGSPQKLKTFEQLVQSEF